MIKRFVLIALLASGFASSALAQSLAKDIATLRNTAEVGRNGGDTYLNRYDVKSFNYKKPTQALLASIKDSDCGYAPVIGREATMKNLEAFPFYEGSSAREARAILERLVRNGQIKAMLGYYWDGSEGDSEYCSKSSLEIFFDNGQVLTLDFDSTT